MSQYDNHPEHQLEMVARTIDSEYASRLADCLLVDKATHAEREKLLRDMAARDDESDHRVRYAQHRLAEPPSDERREG